MNIWWFLISLVGSITSVIYFFGDGWINSWYRHEEKMIDKKIQLKQLELQAINQKQQMQEATQVVEQGGQG